MATNEPALVNIDETTPIIINGLPTTANAPINITELHRYINRCDIVKDANVNPIVKPKTDESLFGRAANTLFPILINRNYFNGSLSVLKNIKDAVFNTKNDFLGGSLGEPPESIVSLKMSSALKNRLKRDIKSGDTISFDEKNLPETYQYSFHDTGDSPGLIQSGIKQILTPGSYIDPAFRDKEVFARLPNDGSTDLSKYGFQGLDFSWKWVGDNKDECKIELRMNTAGGQIAVDETRDKQHGHKGAGKDYFEGNRLKNKWFGEEGKKSNPDTMTAMKYLLCKELGDTTQATFMRLIMETSGSQYNTSNSCLFTLDLILALRARLLGMPCCMKDHGGKDDVGEGEIEEVEPGKEDESPETETKFRRLLFYRPPIGAGQIVKARNTLMVNEAIKHNNTVKYAITTILSGGFYIGSEPIAPQSINQYTRDYFLSIRDMIDIVNGVLTGIANNQDLLSRPEEEFRRMIAYLRANELFKLKRVKNASSFALNTGLRNLFLYDDTPFYQTIMSGFSELRKNQTTNVYQDTLMTPSLDVISNFRDNIFAEGRQPKTFYEHFSFLKTAKDMQGRIGGILAKKQVVAKEITPESTGGMVTTRSMAKQIAKSQVSRIPVGRSRMQTTRRRTASHHDHKIKNYKDFYGLYKLNVTELPPTIYNKDAIDLLWLLHNKLRIDTEFYKSNYQTNTRASASAKYNLDRRLDYIEDFVLFLYPYFAYLGEATYDIRHLQDMHDRFFVPDTNYKNQFYDIIKYYVAEVIKPRESKMKRDKELVFVSNQSEFLKEFYVARMVSPSSVKVSASKGISKSASKRKTLKRSAPKSSSSKRRSSKRRKGSQPVRTISL